jgi:hypothetical protein
MMANPLPMTMKPAARPRRRLPNQAETSPMMGMLAPALPIPAIMYRRRAAANPPAALMAASDKPTESSAKNMNFLGPIRPLTRALSNADTR